MAKTFEVARCARFFGFLVFRDAMLLCSVWLSLLWRIGVRVRMKSDSEIKAAAAERANIWTKFRNSKKSRHSAKWPEQCGRRTDCATIKERFDLWRQCITRVCLLRGCATQDLFTSAFNHNRLPSGESWLLLFLRGQQTAVKSRISIQEKIKVRACTILYQRRSTGLDYSSDSKILTV